MTRKRHDALAKQDATFPSWLRRKIFFNAYRKLKVRDRRRLIARGCTRYVQVKREQRCLAAWNANEMPDEYRARKFYLHFLEYERYGTQTG